MRGGSRTAILPHRIIAQVSQASELINNLVMAKYFCQVKSSFAKHSCVPCGRYYAFGEYKEKRIRLHRLFPWMGGLQLESVPEMQKLFSFPRCLHEFVLCATVPCTVVHRVQYSLYFTVRGTIFLLLAGWHPMLCQERHLFPQDFPSLYLLPFLLH